MIRYYTQKEMLSKTWFSVGSLSEVPTRCLCSVQSEPTGRNGWWCCFHWNYHIRLSIGWKYSDEVDWCSGVPRRPGRLGLPVEGWTLPGNTENQDRSVCENQQYTDKNGNKGLSKYSINTFWIKVAWWILWKDKHFYFPCLWHKIWLAN